MSSPDLGRGESPTRNDLTLAPFQNQENRSRVLFSVKSKSNNILNNHRASPSTQMSFNPWIQPPAPPHIPPFAAWNNDMSNTLNNDLIKTAMDASAISMGESYLFANNTGEAAMSSVISSQFFNINVSAPQEHPLEQAKQAKPRHKALLGPHQQSYVQKTNTEMLTQGSQSSNMEQGYAIKAQHLKKQNEHLEQMVKDQQTKLNESNEREAQKAELLEQLRRTRDEESKKFHDRALILAKQVEDFKAKLREKQSQEPCGRDRREDENKIAEARKESEKWRRRYDDLKKSSVQSKKETFDVGVNVDIPAGILSKSTGTDLADKLNVSEAKNTAVVARNKKLSERIDEYVQNLEATRSQLQEISEERDRLLVQVKGLNHASGQAAALPDSPDHKIEELTNEKEKLKFALDEANANIAKLQSDIQQLQKIRLLAQVDIDQTATNNKIKELHCEKNELKCALEECKSQNERLKNDFEEIQARFKMLEQELDRANKKNVIFVTKQAKLEEDIRASRVLLDGSKSQYQSEIADLNKALDESQQKLKTAKDLCSDISEELEQTKSIVNKSNKDILRLQRKLDEAEAQKRQNSEVLADANERISKLVGENEKLRSEVNAIRLKSSEEQPKNEKTENEQLKITLEELRREFQKASRTNSELIAKVEQFRSENAALSDNLTRAEQTSKMLMADNQSLQSDLRKQEAKMTEARKIVAICLQNEDNNVFVLTNGNSGSRRKSIEKVAKSTPGDAKQNVITLSDDEEEQASGNKRKSDDGQTSFENKKGRND
ncbi:major antigen-like isoform X1 [Ditylenchus destructor]|nr:major antigen-like isoform X1 [Ditylenchus destructor]